VIVALALSTVATALGLLIDRQGDVIGVSFYFLAVARVGGRRDRAGVIAAVLCSLASRSSSPRPNTRSVARVQDAVAASCSCGGLGRRAAGRADDR
jgi:hypothetical protein